MSIRFAAIGLNHNHIYSQVNHLLKAGAELVWYYAAEPDLAADFGAKYPRAQLAESVEQILEDPSIVLVVSAGIPNERAPLGIQVMRHGKDYMTDKPGFTSLAQLTEVRRVQAITKRIYSVFYAERFDSPSTVKASELVQSGAIGQVMQTVGLGPHRLNAENRPPWFFERSRYGGILTDIGSHQVDQFLHFTNSTSAEVVSSQVANFHHPEYPELDDFGDMTLRSDHATGYVRVDWFTPSGLGTWGDVRLFLLGTEGYIELRKNIDIAGLQGAHHLFLVNQSGIQYIDCTNVELPYGEQLISDILNRTETAMTQAHCFLASELALQAQAQAYRVTSPMR